LSSFRACLGQMKDGRVCHTGLVISSNPPNSGNRICFSRIIPVQFTMLIRDPPFWSINIAKFQKLLFI
jgi:hypothetical protein